MYRSPVTKLVEWYNALSDVEQKVFLDLVEPLPDEEPSVKQARKKRGKSAKAQSLSDATAKPPKTEADGDAPCAAQVPTLGVPCGEREDALIHDPKGGYASYHPFVSVVQPVGKKSRQKKETGSSAANSETPPADVGNAAHAASGD